MTDLAEIRRFWPWMPPPHVDYLGHKDYQCDRRGVHYLAHRHQAQWWVSLVNQRSRPWSEVFVDDDGYRIGGGDTIAAAMAAAGFAERKPGPFAERRRQWLAKDPSVHWLHTRRLCEFGPCVCGVQLQSRQRPRKKVRLGKRRRSWWLNADGSPW